MDHTKEQKWNAYSRLPEGVKDFIASLDMVALIKSLQAKHGLHIDQIGVLSNEMGSVIFGLMPSAQFVNRIKQRLNIDQTTADTIAAEVNEAIFLPIRQAMQATGKPDLSELAPAAAPSALSAEQVLKEVENPVPATMLTKQAEPDLLEKKLAKTFVLPRVESATQEDVVVKEVDPYREMPQ